MKSSILMIASAVLTALFSTTLRADVAVFATVPEWGALAKEIGGDKVTVYNATHGLQDPHRIDARPSLIAQARRAQLVVATGAELEVGWLPVVLRDRAMAVSSWASRATWRRPAGRPARGAAGARSRPRRHPRRRQPPYPNRSPQLPQVGEAWPAVWPKSTRPTRRTTGPDTAILPGAGVPPSAAGKGRPGCGRAGPGAAPGLSLPVRLAGLEGSRRSRSQAGVEPTRSHLAELLARQGAASQMVIRAAYRADGPSRWFSQRAGIPAVALPFTVGGTPAAGDLFSLRPDGTTPRRGQSLMKPCLRRSA